MILLGGKWTAEYDEGSQLGLGEGSILMYQSIGCVLIALFSAAEGYATLGTRVLPAWTALWPFLSSYPSLRLPSWPSPSLDTLSHTYQYDIFVIGDLGDLPTKVAEIS